MTGQWPSISFIHLFIFSLFFGRRRFFIDLKSLVNERFIIQPKEPFFPVGVNQEIQSGQITPIVSCPLLQPIRTWELLYPINSNQPVNKNSENLASISLIHKLDVFVSWDKIEFFWTILLKCLRLDPSFFRWPNVFSVSSQSQECRIQLSRNFLRVLRTRKNYLINVLKEKIRC